MSLETILLDALEDERKSKATYAAVIESFGPVRPFINIIEAERRHADAIERQMLRLGFKIPQNPWEDGTKPPASLIAACEQAIDAEIENIALYDQLIPNIEDQIVQNVLQNLQNASRNNHLPAFRRALERLQRGGGGRDGGGGGGRGRGNGCRS